VDIYHYLVDPTVHHVWMVSLLEVAILQCLTPILNDVFICHLYVRVIGCPQPHLCGYQASCHQCVSGVATINCPSPSACHMLATTSDDTTLTSGDSDDCMMWMLFVVTKDVSFCFVLNKSLQSISHRFTHVHFFSNRHVYCSMNGISRQHWNGLVALLRYTYVRLPPSSSYSSRC
jgi:hypothetical protein